MPSDATQGTAEAVSLPENLKPKTYFDCCADEGEDVDHLLLVEIDFGERAGRGGMPFAGAQEIDDLLVGQGDGRVVGP